MASNSQATLQLQRKPEPASIRTIDDEGTLEIDSQWHFRIRIEPDGVRLVQIPAINNWMAPFGLVEIPGPVWPDKEPTFRLETGKPITIYHNVPGGGSRWTLTLLEISEKLPHD